MRLPSLFEDKYPNMNNYINYRLVVVSNNILESIFSNRGDLSFGAYSNGLYTSRKGFK